MESVSKYYSSTLSKSFIEQIWRLIDSPTACADLFIVYLLDISYMAVPAAVFKLSKAFKAFLDEDRSF
jgi:hypothetical protein